MRLGHKPRVLITHQGCVPIYRRPFFDRLARSPHIDYVIAVGDPPRGTDYMTAQPPYAFQTLPIQNYELPLGGKTVIWQPLVSTYWKEFDAVVLGEELKYISHFALAAISKMRGRPFVWWGFGVPRWEVSAKKSTVVRRPLSEFVSHHLRRQASGYLSYTKSGRDRMQQDGFDGDKIAVLNNVVDIEAQRDFRAAVANESDADIRKRLGVAPDVPVLIYFGRFLTAKCVDVLLRYALRRREMGAPICALISGSGFEENNLHTLAAGSPDIVFNKLDDTDLARALKISKAIVIPGFVGLAVTHGFAHGVPMITREGVHPPEIEYLEHGANGLLLPEDEQLFFQGLDAFLASPELQAKLSAGAEHSAANLTMDAMAERFDGLMQQVLARAGRTELSPIAP